jgi:hypothetical protein
LFFFFIILKQYQIQFVDIMDQLSPEQRHAVLMQAQQEANQRIMQDVSQRPPRNGNPKP